MKIFNIYNLLFHFALCAWVLFIYYFWYVMLKRVFRLLVIFIPFAGVLFFSCERERFITEDGMTVGFSVDTVYFDTVFTTLGTVTKSFTVRNPYNESIRLSRIYLAGGEGSVFRINIDGLPGTDFRDVDIAPRDSMYVFVEATLDPNNSQGILLRQDSVVFEVNNTIRDIDLVAWGQDVHILRGAVLNSQTWTNQKPYLIIDSLVVDINQVLTLNPGVKVYFHRNAILQVLGTIEAKGSFEEPILFAGDRLEKMYEDVPGLWGGIWLRAGTLNNILDFVEIRNGLFGIIADTIINDQPTLELSNSTLSHISSVAILGRDAKIRAWNNVFAHCGSSAFAAIGGSYEFYHCTIANRWDYTPFRKNPAVYMSNYYFYNDTLSNGIVVKRVEIRNIEKALFSNCIIYGDLENELIVDKYEGDNLLEYRFENCLGRFSPTVNDLSNPLRFENLINNTDPKFISWKEYKFELDTISPAKDKALLQTALSFPLDKNTVSRLDDGKPDIGAFERKEE